MKIRQGFVSNSSSSSFVVAFKTRPRSEKEVHKMLFPNGEQTVEHYDNNVTTSHASKIVFNDIKAQKANNLNVIADAMNSYGEPGAPDWDAYMDSPTKDWDGYNKADYEFRKKKAQKFLDEHKGMKVYTFSFSDNDGSVGCTMEHGDVFHNLPHIRSSRH